MPASQAARLISTNAIVREQSKDREIEEIKEELEKKERGETHQAETVRHFEMYNGMVCRITRAEQAHEDSLRPYLPTALRNQVMHNFHSSIYGVHRGAASTYREVSSRFFWPGMQEDVGDFVSTCEACQLGKGGCPTRQGLLHGRHYNNAFSQLCLDLVGPINQESGTNDKYVLMMLDPFTHFVWIELIDNKLGDTVYKAFVNRILLEEGAPRCVLTDNGGEFKNKMLSELMTALKVHHQFSPAYHPQSNQTERANRNMTLVNYKTNDLSLRREYTKTDTIGEHCC